MTNSVDARSTGCVDIYLVWADGLIVRYTRFFPITFLDISDEEMNPFPEANIANVQRNAHGRPTQRVSLVSRQQQETGHLFSDKIQANLPTIPSQKCFYGICCPATTSNRYKSTSYATTALFADARTLLSKWVEWCRIWVVGPQYATTNFKQNFCS